MLQSTGRRAGLQLTRCLLGPATQQRFLQAGMQPTTGMLEQYASYYAAAAVGAVLQHPVLQSTHTFAEVVAHARRVEPYAARGAQKPGRRYVPAATLLLYSVQKSLDTDPVLTAMLG